MTSTTIPVNPQGAQILLKKIQKKYGLESGDILSLIELDDLLVLSPKPSRVSELAGQIETMRRKAGLRAQDLTKGLAEQRRRYNRVEKA
jgi:bifunctional DNA-binding transcriptional regulator/antitoxin component of YhaV-PrlF toxin-antitoxin module